MFKIGNIIIKNQIVMAPMAGISNSAYRRIIKEMGAGLVYAEMVSDKAIYYQNKKTIKILKMTEEERPIVQQIFGSDIKTMVLAAKYIYQTMKPDIIDINMGCPVLKVAVKNSAGAALMKDPQKAFKLVQAVVNAVPIPVTVKIRSGWDEKQINAVEIAQLCEKAGAKAIAVHPRTKQAGYGGKANWQIIKTVKENVKIPVIGNGDIKTPEEAALMLQETNCDAVMIGRALLGNPWLIKDCLNYLNKEPIKQVTNLEKVLMLEKHFNYSLQDKDEKIAVLEIRKFALWYLKKIPDSKDLYQNIIKLKSSNDVLKLIEQYKERFNG